MKPKRILVVDDKEENRYLLRILLENAGFAVAEASHGAEALALARSEQPDLVVSDVLMPIMDGFAFCREWKRDAFLRAISFTFYTATYTDGRDRDFALSLGADDFIVKPQEPDALLERLLELLQAPARPSPAPAASSPPPVETEEVFLRQYNEALVRKLETKMEQLERDIAARRQAEAALRDSEERFRSFVENANDIVFTLTPEGLFTYVSPKWTEWLGHASEDVVGHFYGEFVHPEDLPVCQAAVEEVLRGNKQSGVEYQVRHMDASWHWHMTNASLIHNASGQPTILGIARDITDQRQAAEEREQLQSQMNQLQKIESVGRLAGGVAHDFNNMLQIILGHVELALDHAEPGQPVHNSLLEIRQAAERSAGLTRQLLAFARKQTVTPRILDLNETVEGMLQMLRRLIEDNIELTWHPGAKTGTIRMDPSQIDQILANLCVNARDAMPRGGTLAIETSHASFNDADCARHPLLLPGHYVRLTVRDTGIGMDEVILGKIFEPFFTTKEVGKGTGLGLATVFGIVKQNRGFIDVASQPGHGTAFHIYLPRHAESAPAAPATDTAIPQGLETILLAEDDPSILAIARTMLERLGYHVIGAASQEEAFAQARDYPGSIQLLMTDVVMPGMNGRDLAQALHERHPGLKCLFTSGYASDVVAQHVVLAPGIHFIQKPFTLAELSAKVREALESNAP